MDNQGNQLRDKNKNKERNHNEAPNARKVIKAIIQDRNDGCVWKNGKDEDFLCSEKREKDDNDMRK